VSDQARRDPEMLSIPPKGALVYHHLDTSSMLKTMRRDHVEYRTEIPKDTAQAQQYPLGRPGPCPTLGILNHEALGAQVYA
jgi:hypothetical protein